MGFLPTNASRRRSCPSARSSLCRVINRLTCVTMFTVQRVRPAGRTQMKRAAYPRRPVYCADLPYFTLSDVFQL